MAAAAAPRRTSDGEQVMVTGSHIARTGFSSPTPVTVMGAADIAAQQPANISDLVNQMPSVTQGSTSSSSSGFLSSGLAGINSVNLRGLGANRTLILIDGQRSIASSSTGLVDVNTIPQNLVQRVEVVTGGASAQYGSDAVGGVVNFILNKNFKGVKLDASTGFTTYADDPYYKLDATIGKTFLGGKLHVLVDAQYYQRFGVDSIDRPWNNSGYFQIDNPNYTPHNGQPQLLVGSGFAPFTYSAGGLITSGPLTGTYFKGNGQTGQLNYGVHNATSNPYMIGGDTATTLDGHVGTNSLAPSEDRIGVFNRTSYDISDNTEIFGQFSWNKYQGQSYYQQTPSTGVVINSDNAYLNQYYPAVAGKLAAAGQKSFTMGTSNAGFPVPGSNIDREVFRYVGGMNGKFNFVGNKWHWDWYYQYGRTLDHVRLINTWNNARMAQAQDAVVNNGQIVCRSSITDPNNGCVPIDRLGTAGPSAAALNYIYEGSAKDGPTRDQTLQQHVAAFDIGGTMFHLPGGNASIAMGGDWRRESIDGDVDPIYTSGWLYGNYRVTKGAYNVKEGYIELDMPVWKGFDIDAAGRYTDYSTSGSVETWKAGATYSPIPDIKFRGTFSHDIRAPNLNEMFAAGTARTNTVILPANAPLTGSQAFTENTVGNPHLAPETANTWTVGAVVSPRFLPGFMASFDYYDIDIKNAIGSVTSQQTVDFCYSGGAAYCNNIHYTNGQLSTITIQPFNFASQKERGFDIAASYRIRMSNIWKKLPGVFNVHGEITRYISNVINNNTYPINYAGVNGGTLSGTYNEPSWDYRISAFYNLDNFTFNLTARGFSAGVYGNDYVQCTTNCPVSTPQYRTINNNRIAGAVYFDTSLSYEFNLYGRAARTTFVMSNMMNTYPVLVGNGPSGNNVPAYAQTNPSLYDTVGRTFRLAMSVSF
ncbi:TonB-dependent receptor [Gluconacetobacter sp. 1b LMG 1731]|uniref:TonB-dependent receptor n=1 Tax=Gluconacetobacter dulcium TaxID=2729096 RepID=A0A7W4IME3_9PROT|nr:TonB-dependent receptor [Gluconacetobacter dulcium]MBB2165518.1 TonB-dependent receptor [Gluconacetobacter dulcium]MBB2194654.1 TonB-dependent receptor [Gluconacetobacter dulcium]